jgi:hypothetical protein
MIELADEVSSKKIHPSRTIDVRNFPECGTSPAGRFSKPPLLPMMPSQKGTNTYIKKREKD